MSPDTPEDNGFRPPPVPPPRTALRRLPAVDRLAVAVARAALAERRTELLHGAAGEVDLVERAVDRLRPSLRRVLNATGVIVHTNLGRAPLAPAARAAVARVAAGYSNLELDLKTGERGLPPRPRRPAGVRADRGRGGDGGQQLRGRGPAGRRRAGGRGSRARSSPAAS